MAPAMNGSPHDRLARFITDGILDPALLARRESAMP